MDAIEYRQPRTALVSPGEIDARERDMTATVAGDVTLRALQERLATVNQWLPIDGDPDSPIGALVDYNSTGPLRLGYGAWRDLLLGVQFTNGRGALITAGGQTVKNVAGYDLTKFMVGQRGVFGTLMTLTMRTYRRPEGALLAAFAPDVARLGALLPTPLRPQWAILAAESLACGYVGDAEHLAFCERELAKTDATQVLRRGLDDDIASRAALWRVGGAETFRASVPPARIREFVTAAQLSLWYADAAFGIVVGSLADRREPSSVAAAADAVGGSATVYDDENPASAPFSTNPAERQIIERLKRAFDPDARLAPLPWQHR